jgi:hypothetical protein
MPFTQSLPSALVREQRGWRVDSADHHLLSRLFLACGVARSWSGMLKPKVLPQILQQAVSGGVKGVLYVESAQRSCFVPY